MVAFGAIIVALLAWWIATGAVLFLARQGEKRRGMVVALMTAIAAGGIAGLYVTGESMSAAGAYGAFFSALALWAWHEAVFLLGLVTGPRRVGRDQLPHEASRFQAAFMAVRDHEIALAITVAGMAWLMHDVANKTGLVVFILLWVMRLSTKFNIFLGAPNAISDMLPERLDYLKSYFRTDRTSTWFFMSLAIIVALFGASAAAAVLAAEPHGVVMWSLIATFAALALVEHLFLVLPVRDSALWNWAMPEKVERPATPIPFSEEPRAERGT